MNLRGNDTKSAEIAIKQCDHCSGVVEKQSIFADGEPYFYYECKGCGCQWDTKGYRMTVGTREECENQWLAMQHRAQNSINTIPRKTWIIIAVVAALMILPFTGSILMALSVRLLLALRVFIVPISVSLIAYLIYRQWKKHNSQD
jgi:hypothetical protein